MIRIRVPATSANLGPGFDALGLALDLHNRFEVEIAKEFNFAGCPAEFANEGNLFIRAARCGAEALGVDLPAFNLRFVTRVPLARGLGSSATLIIGGLLAARELLDAGAALDDRRILSLAASLEGHPDNTTPALLGGFSVAVMDGGAVTAIRSPVGGELRFSALIPPFALETVKARAALPSTVSFRDAAWNSGRSSLVTAAFLARDWSALDAAMRDRLHESYRSSLIPGFEAATAACRESGALAVYLSGAGPTIMALSLAGDSQFASRMDTLCARMKPLPWRHLPLAADDEGARVEA